MKRLKPLPRGYDKHTPREAAAEKEWPQGAFRWAWGHTTDVVVEVEADVEIDIFAPVCFDGEHLRAAASLPCCKREAEIALRGVAEFWLGVAAERSPLGHAGVIRVQTSGVFTCEPHGAEEMIERRFVGLHGNKAVVVNDIRQAIGRGLGVSRGLFSSGDWLIEIGIGGPPFLAKEFRTMSGELTLQKRITTVYDMLNQHKDQLAMALPKHITTDRMIRIVMTSLRKTPKLTECTQESLFSSIITSAQLGLECDGVQGQAYLAPFRNNKKGCLEAQLIVGYHGYMDLARRSGDIGPITAEVVHANDKFREVKGASPDLIHEPLRPGERGEIIGAYAVAQYLSGAKQFAYLTVSEIIARRDATPGSRKGAARSDSAWKTSYAAMCKKTAVRALCNMLPQSVEIRRADALEQANDDRLALSMDITAGLPMSPTPAIEAESTPAEPAPEAPAANIGNLADAIAAVYAADSEKAVDIVVGKAKIAWTLDPPEIVELDEAASKRKVVLRGDGA